MRRGFGVPYDIRTICLEDALLASAHCLRIMSRDEQLNSLRHAAHKNIPVIRLDQPFVNKWGHLFPFAVTGSNDIPQWFIDSQGPGEFFEIHGKHLKDIDSTHWQRPKMIRLDPEHRTGVDNIEAIVLCKVTHPGDGVSATLHLIKKQKCLRIRSNRRWRQCGDSHNEVIEALCLPYKLDRVRPLHEVDFQEASVVVTGKLLDSACFANLSSTGNKQSLPGFSLFPVFNLLDNFTLEHACLLLPILTGITAKFQL